MELSVVIPAHNEADNLPQLLHEIHTALSRHAAYEVIVVDDGSSDSTPAVLHDIQADFAQLRIVRHASSCGQSTALIRKSIVGFVFNRRHGFFFFHIREHASALNHESLDHAVEGGSIEVFFCGVFQKILSRDWSLLSIQANFNFAKRICFEQLRNGGCAAAAGIKRRG